MMTIHQVSTFLHGLWVGMFRLWIFFYALRLQHAHGKIARMCQSKILSMHKFHLLLLGPEAAELDVSSRTSNQMNRAASLCNFLCAKHFQSTTTNAIGISKCFAKLKPLRSWHEGPVKGSFLVLRIYSYSKSTACWLSDWKLTKLELSKSLWLQ